jgi:hypothetical protein
MSGFQQPNYTQAPNAFFDHALKQIDSMSELKVTLAVIRHTMGFHRDEHELSLSYLVEYTGMRRETVIDGLKRAMKRGTVDRRPSGNTFAYFMKVQAPLVGKPDHPASAGSRKTGPKVVGKPDPRKKEKESNDLPSGKSAGRPPKRINGITKLMDRVNAARENGNDVQAITPKSRKSIGEFYKQYELDGAGSDHLEWALDYMVAKASGKVDGEPKAWCGFGTAMDRVRLDGWRPKAKLRAVRDPEHEKMVEENARLEQELIDEALGGMA